VGSITQGKTNWGAAVLCLPPHLGKMHKGFRRKKQKKQKEKKSIRGGGKMSGTGGKEGVKVLQMCILKHTTR